MNVIEVVVFDDGVTLYDKILLLSYATVPNLTNVKLPELIVGSSLGNPEATEVPINII